MTLSATRHGAPDRRPLAAHPGSVPGVEVHGQLPGADLVALTASALVGDRAAWEGLVDRLKGAAWAAIGGVDLPFEDRKDAFASTFFRLYEKLGSVEDPARLHGWVSTTARREALAIARARRRETSFELVDEYLEPVADVSADHLLDQEMRRAMGSAFARLSQSCQRLLRLLTADPPPHYAEVSRLLGMKIGSIGPTRQRCLARLRAMPELQPFRNEAAL